MVEFIDDRDQLPIAPWAKCQSWFFKALAHSGTYTQKHQEFVTLGWTFDDALFGTQGTDAELSENYGEMEPAEWETFVAAASIGHGAWIPGPADLVANVLGQVFSLVWGEMPVVWSHETYLEAFGAPGLLSPRIRFFTGITTRVLARYVQTKAAMQLANVFCLDNRGRPEGS